MEADGAAGFPATRSESAQAAPAVADAPPTAVAAGSGPTAPAALIQAAWFQSPPWRLVDPELLHVIELSVPVAAGGHHRRAIYCGWRVAESRLGLGGAAGGGEAGFRGVESGWPLGWWRVEAAAAPPSPWQRLGCRWEQVAYGHGGAARGRGCDLKAWGAAGGVGGGGSRWQPRPQPQGGGWGAGGSRWMAWARAVLRLARGRGSSWPRRRCWRRGGAILRRESGGGGGGGAGSSRIPRT
eukprot:scaffold3385_cov119-Isochrysis_galbana.AAC.1